MADPAIKPASILTKSEIEKWIKLRTLNLEKSITTEDPPISPSEPSMKIQVYNDLVARTNMFLLGDLSLSASQIFFKISEKNDLLHKSLYVKVVNGIQELEDKVYKIDEGIKIILDGLSNIEKQIKNIAIPSGSRKPQPEFGWTKIPPKTPLWFTKPRKTKEKKKVEK